jgi:aspartyl-tRNA(Asn)/glutamyl-tRNA(Gln) amidotransferase subunit B
MATYIPTIGLEIHAELRTEAKMFCGCLNDPDAHEPNQLICPVCVGHPGTLPTINRKAVESVLKVGVALGGTIADYTEFDRKNYFYPDIPKGYQISQYQYPLVSGGELTGKKITRIHLEEDTAKSNHESADESLIDFNRSGVPLMELVTEPVIHTAAEAGTFARELRLLLRRLGVSNADMEKGQMRVEANISISKDSELGTKVEVKNLNSFRSVERAIDYEIARQTQILDSGKMVDHETRGWDEARQVTFSQRKKEKSHDYRYFPDPDLPKLKISEISDFSSSRISEIIPELPQKTRERLGKLGIAQSTIETFLTNQNLELFFNEVTKDLEDTDTVVTVSNYIATDLQALLKETTLKGRDPLTEPVAFRKIMEMLNSGELSSKGAKSVIVKWFEEGGDPAKIATELGVIQNSDIDSIARIVDEIIVANPTVVAECKAGKESALQYLVGQVMKVTKGSANPAVLQKIIREKVLG